MQKALIMVDSCNIYFCLKYKFGSNKLDFRKLSSYIEGHGFQVYRALVYSANTRENDSFKRFLQNIGYEPVFGEIRYFEDGASKGNFDSQMIVDTIRILDNVDVVVLVTGDGDFEPLVRYIQEKGKRCFVYGANISKKLTETANDYFEFSEDFVLKD